MIVDYGLCNVDSTVQIVVKDIHCGSELILYYDCGLWIVYCGFHNSDCGERYTLRIGTYLMTVDYGLCIVNSTIQIVEKDIRCGSELILSYDCGLWIVYCGFHNADCGERYTLWIGNLICGL